MTSSSFFGKIPAQNHENQRKESYLFFWSLDYVFLLLCESDGKYDRLEVADGVLVIDQMSNEVVPLRLDISSPPVASSLELP